MFELDFEVNVSCLGGDIATAVFNQTMMSAAIKSEIIKCCNAQNLKFVGENWDMINKDETWVYNVHLSHPSPDHIENVIRQKVRLDNFGKMGNYIVPTNIGFKYIRLV